MVTTSRIPLNQNAPWYEYPITLAGQRYIFEVQYNVRSDRWMLNIKDATGAMILAGIALLLRRYLLLQYPTLPLPAGTLYVDQTSGGPLNQPGISSFLTTHTLYFIEP